MSESNGNSEPAQKFTARDDHDFEIVDSTSPEQLQREATLLATGRDEGEAPGAQVHKEQAGSELAGDSEPDPPLLHQDPVPAPEKPLSRSYSQAEVSKMQASWARQIEEAKRSAESAAERLSQFNVDAAVEALLRRQESELARSVGSQQAEQLVRSPQNTALARQTLVNQQFLTRSETDRKQAILQQERQAQYIVARDLARKHGVSSDDFNLLASAATPLAMERLAARLGRQNSEVQHSVPPENPGTRLENGYHTGPAPDTPGRRLDRIRSRPSWEWTEADLRFMKTGEVV